METGVSFFNLVIIAVLGALACITFVILDIIAIINKNKNRIIFFSVGFVLSLSLILGSIWGMFRKTTNLFKSSMDYAKENYNEPFNDAYDSTIENERQAFKDSIKKFSLAENIPADFFENNGKDEWYRVPMVFPYSLNMITELKYASLKNDKKTNYETGEYDANLIENISYAAFDSQMLLCRVEKVVNTSPNQDLTNPDFVLFYFSNAKKQNFNSFDDMLKFAKKQGYQGKEDLVPVSEIYYQWF